MSRKKKPYQVESPDGFDFNLFEELDAAEERMQTRENLNVYGKPKKAERNCWRRESPGGLTFQDFGDS